MKKIYVRDRLLKNSLLTCVTALTVGAGLVINTQIVKASDVDNDSTEVSQLQNSATNSTTSSVATKATSTVISDKPATTALNSDTNTTEKQVPEETQLKAATSANSTTQSADASEQENDNNVSDASVSKPQATPVTKADGNNQITNVNKDNFNDYFTTNGTATYDQKSGVVTLTPDQNNKIGNFTLNEKIDLSQDFTLKGGVNLGNKTQSKGGADGMGFAFHNGNTGDLGNAGGNMGIGGLQNALGFKLDTYHNNYQAPNSSQNNAEIDYNNSNDFGWAADPTNSTQFGAFVTTSNQNIIAKNKKPAQRWWAETDAKSVKALSASDLDNKFHDFTIAYTADNREIKISYADNSKGTLVWNSAVPTSYGDSLALSVTSSTGGNKNKHQFRLDSLEFTKAASVNVRHIDYFTGKDLVEDTVSYPNGASVGGTYQTAVKDIPGYYYVGLNGTTATITAQGQSVSLPIKVIDKETGRAVENSIPAMGEMQQEGNNGTVVYVYMPVPDKIDVTNAIKQSNVNETIHYVDADTGETIATDYKAPEITFIKGTKAGKTITLYHNDKDGSSTDQTTWSVSNNGSFEEVVNPVIDGYKIQSVEENGVSQADLTAVESKETFFGDKDKEITVYYVKDNDASVQVRHIDYFTGKDIATDNTLTYSNGAIVGSTYTTNPMNVNGYKYVALNGQTIDVKGTKIPINVKGVESSLPASGDLIKGDNGTVTYVYVPTDFQIIKSPVNETIHYVEEGTNLPLASDYQADPIIFVQVTRNGKSVVMYHNENDGLSMDDPNAWHNADNQNANFKEIRNPEIAGYHVVKNDANSDLDKVEMKSTNYQGTDQEYTVYYARDVDALVNVRHIDYFTGKDIVSDNTLMYPNGAHSGENYTSNSMDIPGYKYIGLNGSSVTVNLNGQTMTLPINVKNEKISIPATGTLTKGDNGTVIYVYLPTLDSIKTSTVNETIHYVDYDTNEPVATDHVANKITFVQATKGDKTVTFYHNGNNGSLKDPKNWNISNTGVFNEVKNPEIDGYKIYRVQGQADLENVEAKLTEFGGKDQDYTVYYVKDTDAMVRVRHIDYFTGEDIVDDTTLTYPNGASQGNEYSSTKENIPNYTYIGLNGSKPEISLAGFNLPATIYAKNNREVSLSSKGTLNKIGDNGTIIYVYVPTPSGISYGAHTVRETIHYVEIGTNDTLHADYISPSIIFVNGSAND